MEASSGSPGLINEAVVPLHIVVPNPYTLLAQIPSGTTYYSVLDLKDVFFCIPLHHKSQAIFAFEDPTRNLDRSLELVLPQATLLQYVDDLLLCGPNEPVIS
jgi:hypothetical protein